jgi:REP-associated tyrosine transposase
MSGKPSSDNDPPEFEPTDPWRSDHRTFRKRSLPHLEVLGATYFVTFGSMWRNPLPPEARDEVLDVILDLAGKSIELDAAVVMPNHVHLVFRLLSEHSLGRILRQIKGSSARRVNRLLRAKGAVWMNESFDHIVRDGLDLDAKIEYVRQNPVKRGLVQRAVEYRWLFLRSSAK